MTLGDSLGASRVDLYKPTIKTLEGVGKTFPGTVLAWVLRYDKNEIVGSEDRFYCKLSPWQPPEMKQYCLEEHPT